MSSKEVWIVSAKRTCVGRFLGALADTSAADLGIAAGRAALQSLGEAPEHAGIDQVIVGNVLGAGLGMNVARQIGLGLGLPITVPAFSVNMMCASGLQAAILAAGAIRAGDAHVVLCGGSEAMSQAPYLLQRARSGYKFGDGTLVDSLLRDGLTDAASGEHMGLTAERVARELAIDRAAQDAFAFQSQQRYAAAEAAGTFAAERVSVGKLDRDEQPRPETALEKLATLKPVFDAQGTVTAGNASGINDGAAMLVLAEAATARARGWQPLARITGSAAVGCDPQRMGLGPVGAIRALGEKLGRDPKSFATVELNEAFAAQALGCLGQLGLDQAKVNCSGGAIALGHPIGASGARILTHAAHRIACGQAADALVSLCVGGGMGVAMAIEQP